MKKILICTILFLFCSAAMVFAFQRITDKDTMTKFAKVVRIKGYSCGECVQADFAGKKHRGKEFRIICDYERNAFRVTVASGDFIVEPW